MIVILLLKVWVEKDDFLYWSSTKGITFHSLYLITKLILHSGSSTLRFVGASLEELACILSQDQFQNLRLAFSNFNDYSLKLLTRKADFCYDYIDSLEKLNETKLPRINHLYNTLNDCELFQEQYNHVHTVFNHFLYLKTDVMLLTDIFEIFRDKAHKTYSLNPAWYYTMLKYTWNWHA